MTFGKYLEALKALKKKAKLHAQAEAPGSTVDLEKHLAGADDPRSEPYKLS